MAKCAVLEILTLAETEQRPCHLFFFSGSEELQELDIPPAPISEQAWQAILLFLQKSFRGGTDLDGPLAASVQRLRREGWQSADILLITDSKVEQPSLPVLRALEDLRGGGLRIFGLVVAEEAFDKGAKCLAELCDEVRSLHH